MVHKVPTVGLVAVPTALSPQIGLQDQIGAAANRLIIANRGTTPYWDPPDAPVPLARAPAGQEGISDGSRSGAFLRGLSDASGSAALTALAFFAAYTQKAQIASIDLMNPIVVVCLLLGAMLPFLFSALTMSAVGSAAQEMINEVRRQFNEIPGLREGKPGVKCDSTRCVSISTEAALKRMVQPGLLAIAAPVVVGVGFRFLDLCRSSTHDRSCRFRSRTRCRSDDRRSPDHR